MSPGRGRVADGDLEGTSPHTQMPFGTQMVRPSRAPVEDDDVQVLGVNRLEPVLAGNTRREELPADNTGSHSAKQAALLNLLNRNGNQNAGQRTAPSTGGFARTSAVNQPHGLGPSPSQLRSPLTMRYGPPDRPQPASPISTIGRTESLRADSDGGGQHDMDVEMISEPQEVEQPLDEPFGIDQDDDDLEAARPAWVKGFQLTRESANPPQDQLSLLLKPECWQKPLPGYRFPDGNIPIRILIALGERAAEAAAAAAMSDDEMYGPPESPLRDQDHDAEEEPPTSELSWSPTPTPEMPELPHRPKRVDQALPPDSSLGAGKDAAYPDGEDGAHASGRMLSQPVTVESSNEHEPAGPPSSPPLVPANEDSDEEMELETAVPRGLGEDQSSGERAAASKPPPVAVVQVKDTPYAKGKNGQVPKVNSPESLRQQTSSGTSKDTSSTSIVYCTYKEPNSSGERRAAVSAGAKLSTTAGEAPDRQERSVEPAVAEEASAHAQKHVRLPPAETSDIPMADADSPGAGKFSKLELTTTTSDPQDQDMPLLQPEPTPVSFQMPPKELSSSGEQMVHRPDDLEQPRPNATEPVAAIPLAAHTKRKLDESPSKKSSRHSKRREIKIVGFDDDSPVKDTAAAVRQLRTESMEKFMEGRRSDASVTTTSRISPNGLPPRKERSSFTAELDARAGAERLTSPTYKISPSRTSLPFHSTSATTSPRLMVRQGRSPNGRASEAREKQEGVRIGKRKERDAGDHSNSRGRNEGPTEEPSITRPPTTTSPLSAAYRTDTSRMEMEIDEPLEVQKASKEIVHAAHKPPSQAPQGPVPMSNLPSPASRGIATQTAQPNTIFQEFKAAYPEYKGDEKHFMGQCKQMYKLDMEDKMVPKWQWDDYIIRNRTDYKSYVLACMDTGEDAEPYYRFYKDQIRDTIYKKSVIDSRRTLLAALEELGAQPAIPEPIAEPATKPFRKSLPWGTSQHEAAAVEPVQSSLGDRPRHSLPAGTHKGLHSSNGGSALRSSSLHKSATLAPIQPTAPALSRSGTSTPLSRRQSDNNPASSRADGASKIPTEPTGDEYRDFVFAYQRMTSLTGSTRVRSRSPLSDACGESE